MKGASARVIRGRAGVRPGSMGKKLWGNWTSFLTQVARTSPHEYDGTYFSEYKSMVKAFKDQA